MDENSNNNIDAKNENNNFKKVLIAIILAGIAAIIVTIIAVTSAANNNKKLSASQRIESLIDDITNSEISNNYYASQKLKEAESLIQKYSLNKDFDAKYNEAKKYVNDSKIYNKAAQSLLNFDNNEDTFVKINQQFASLSSKRVLSYLDSNTGRMYLDNLKQIAEKIIIARAIGNMQQKFKETYPDAIILDTLLCVPDQYGSIRIQNDNRFVFSGLGIKGLISKEPEISEIDYIKTNIIKETAFDIDEKNNGYAFVVVYRNPENDLFIYDRSDDDYSNTSNWYYYSGFTIDASFNNGGCIQYKVTEYSNGKEKNSFMSAEEITNFNILNI